MLKQKALTEICKRFCILRLGAPGAIRTPDPLVRSQVLYPAELRAREGRIIKKKPGMNNAEFAHTLTVALRAKFFRECLLFKNGLLAKAEGGGERGIRTLDAGLSPHTPLAGERLRPLGHLSENAAKDTRVPRSRSNNYTVFSSSKALCKTRTASSKYFSSMTTEIFISEVEII